MIENVLTGKNLHGKSFLFSFLLLSSILFFIIINNYKANDLYTYLQHEGEVSENDPMSTLKWETAKVLNIHLLDEFRLDGAFSLHKIVAADNFYFNHLAGVIPTLNEFIEKCLNEKVEKFGIKDYRVRSILK